MGHGSARVSTLPISSVAKIGSPCDWVSDVREPRPTNLSEFAFIRSLSRHRPYEGGSIRGSNTNNSNHRVVGITSAPLLDLGQLGGSAPTTEAELRPDSLRRFG
jgi:hypothetical protein